MNFARNHSARAQTTDQTGVNTGQDPLSSPRLLYPLRHGTRCVFVYRRSPVQTGGTPFDRRDRWVRSVFSRYRPRFVFAGHISARPIENAGRLLGKRRKPRRIRRGERASTERRRGTGLVRPMPFQGRRRISSVYPTTTTGRCRS